MFNAAVFVLTTSYVAWYFQEHELRVVYPFDTAQSSPTAAGVPDMTDARFETEDGETLVVWRVKAAEGFPTILYFSGNAGGLKERSDRFETFIERGYGVIAPAYRGSSGSTGMPEQDVLLKDARAIVQSEADNRIYLYGESLGTALVVRLASEGIGERVVLEAPFTSIPDLVARQHPSEDLDHLITQRWESLQYINDVTQPLLIVHGERDYLVPVTMGQDMFDAAGSADKDFLRIEGASHSQLWTPEMQTVLFDFLSAD